MESSTSSMDPPLLNNDYQEEEEAAAAAVTTTTNATSTTEEKEQQQPVTIATAATSTTEQQQQQPVTTKTTPSMTQPVLSTSGSTTTTAANDIEQKESTTSIEERGTDYYYAYSQSPSSVGGTTGVVNNNNNNDEEESSNVNYHSLPEYPDAFVAPTSKTSYHAYKDDEDVIDDETNRNNKAIGNLRIYLLFVLIVFIISSPFWLEPDYYHSNPLSAYSEIQQCTDYSYDESKVDNWGNLPCKVKNMCGQEGSGQSPIDIAKTYCTEDRCIGENAVSVVKESNILNYYSSYNENVCTLMDLTSKLVADVSAKTYYTFASTNCTKPTIEIEQEEWELNILQFHTGGSEHTIDSIRYDGELHLIHTKVLKLDSNETTTDDDSSSTLIIAIPLTSNNPYYYNYYNNNNDERRRKLEEDNNNNQDGGEQDEQDGENNENNNNNNNDREEEEDGEDNNNNEDENNNNRDNNENNNDEEDNYNYEAEDEEEEQYYDSEEDNNEKEEQNKQYYANDDDNAYKSYDIEPLLIYYEAISENLSNACDETTSVKQRTKTLPTYVDSNYIDHTQVTLNDEDYYYNGADANIIDVWSPYNLIPSNAGVYMYDGTFTTPPCSSGVKWIIMDVPLQISKNQMKRLNKVVSSTQTPKWPSCEYSDDDDDDDDEDEEYLEKHSTYRPIQSQSSKVVDHECTFLSTTS